MIKNKNKIELKNFFDYKRKNSISIIRIVSMVMFFLIVFNIANGIIEIKNIQNYILENNNNDSILTDLKKELIKEDKNNIINLENVRKIFETVGEENIDSIYVDLDSVQVIGKSKDMKTIEILMKNKILEQSYIRKIEFGKVYNFEINSGAN